MAKAIRRDKLPKYSMVFTYRIFRVEDSAEVANVFRGFRGDSLKSVLSQFRKLAAKQKAPRERKA